MTQDCLGWHVLQNADETYIYTRLHHKYKIYYGLLGRTIHILNKKCNKAIIHTKVNYNVEYSSIRIINLKVFPFTDLIQLLTAPYYSGVEWTSGMAPLQGVVVGSRVEPSLKAHGY